ncbi:MAG: glycine cleavage system aminomethyltransferase GcvT [bacterium]|nr:glycine cleavage system aminomethyltransferase GcvT [bacterium]
MTPKTTPLYKWHQEAGGRIVDFAGWKMPVYYTTIIKEHLQTRSHAGLFDISHMGFVELSGPEAGNALQFLTTNNVAVLKNGQAQYSLLLNEAGTIIDDIIVYRRAENDFRICVNASNTDKDFEWIQKQGSRFNVHAVNHSDQTGLIALQGPKAAVIFQKVSPIQLEAVPRFSFIEIEIEKIPLFVARTGYTGEDGFEIFCPWDQTKTLWQILLEAGKNEGLVPVGLGARDTLRVEMKYSLYGHEIDDSTNPYEAGLGWVVKLDKGNFIGKEKLTRIKDKGIERKLVCLEMKEAGIARQGFSLHSSDDNLEKIGQITSGTFSPSLEKAIAIGYLKKEFSENGTRVKILIRKDYKEAEVVPAPFYKK